MITGAHQLGWDGDLTVQAAETNSTAIMHLSVNGHVEWLERRDVEHLRDLCDEALA